MDLFGARTPGGVFVGHRAGGIGQELDVEALVHGMHDRRGVAVVRHEADDRQRVDPARGEPAGQVGLGKRARQGLVDVVVVRPLDDDRVQRPAG